MSPEEPLQVQRKAQDKTSGWGLNAGSQACPLPLNNDAYPGDTRFHGLSVDSTIAASEDRAMTSETQSHLSLIQSASTNRLGANHPFRSVFI